MLTIIAWACRSKNSKNLKRKPKANRNINRPADRRAVLYATIHIRRLGLEFAKLWPTLEKPLQIVKLKQPL